MKNFELREKISNFNKDFGVTKIPRSSVVNDVFPEGFNYSIAEEPIMKKFGSYFPVKNWGFSIFQPCVRVTDFRDLVKQGKKFHLSSMEMVDLGGIHLIKNKSQLLKIKEKAIQATYNFLTKELSFNSEKIFVSYFSGNTLSNLSKGKSKKEEYIPADSETYQIWKKLGLKENQFIKSREEDTFVLTFLPADFYGGYRSELFINISDSKISDLLEIGTFEFLDYKTSVDSKGNFVDLLPMEGAIGGSVIGLERTLVAVNKYKHIFECDHIAPLVVEIMKDAKNKDFNEACILTDTIRTTHLILSDIKCLIGNEHEKRREVLRRFFLKTIYKSSVTLEIDIDSKIKNYLFLNSKSQPWLELDIDFPQSIIKKYRFGKPFKI